MSDAGPTLGHVDESGQDATLVIRSRRPEDIPALATVLLEQQPSTRYPYRNPLPVPVEQFLHAEDAAAAWTAELDGRPVGHVCRISALSGFPDAARMNEVCARAHGCTTDELTWISTLFVGSAGNGLGIGRRLLDTVITDAREAGLRPCLEVLPVHAAALKLYEATGWRVVDQLRPGWLPATDTDCPDVRVMVLDSPDRQPDRQPDQPAEPGREPRSPMRPG